MTEIDQPQEDPLQRPQTLIDFVYGLEKLAKDMRQGYEFRTPEQLKAIIHEMVESYAEFNAFHSADLGSYRNIAVRTIANYLTTLQEKHTFQDAYKVTYDVKKEEGA